MTGDHPGHCNHFRCSLANTLLTRPSFGQLEAQQVGNKIRMGTVSHAAQLVFVDETLLKQRLCIFIEQLFWIFQTLPHYVV